MNDLSILPAKDLRSRVFVAALVLLALGFSWFAVRWQLADMLADVTRRDDPEALGTADLAVRLAPSDPGASAFRAYFGTDATSPDRRRVIEIARETVRLAPNDYRWRIELARELTRDEQWDAAEAEFNRAIDLAPGYAQTRWYFGNFLLRRERTSDALAQLKLAAVNNARYRDQVFSLAWDFFDKDVAPLEDIAGDDATNRAALAYFLAAHGHAADALRNWNALSDEEKKANVIAIKLIAQGLYEKRFYAESLLFSQQLGNDLDSKAEAITNPSFEKGIDSADGSRFGWQLVRNDAKVDIAIDSSARHEGARSLRVTFRGYAKPALANVFQMVIVEPGRHYRLRAWVRTESLKSAGNPMLEIANAQDGTSLARSKPFATGTADWHEVILDFATPENSTAIQIRTIREFCGENCPVTGIFWYDDLDLSRL